MPQIHKFRKGWQSEHIAKAILSQLCFIAHPAQVADDIGMDFFCTLFHIEKTALSDNLIPKNSFAIQIKSSSSQKNITNLIGYIHKLNIPFLWGILDRKKLKLKIYSGEYFYQFISLNTPKSLFIKLVDSRSSDFWEKKNENHYLYFPLVAEIGFNLSDHRINNLSNELNNLCTHIQANISSRNQREYIFKHYGTNLYSIVTGRDSANSFRENFQMRLAESFANLNWIYRNRRNIFNVEEFDTYKRLYNDLVKLGFTIHPILRGFYNDLNSKLEL